MSDQEASAIDRWGGGAPDESIPGGSIEAESRLVPFPSQRDEADVPAVEPAEPPPYSAADFDPDSEPFDLPGTEKLGIVGGQAVGKSYLFQAMVYRTLAGAYSGALNYYLDGTRLFWALDRRERARALQIGKFAENYRLWERLPKTYRSAQHWYRLRLRYRTGLLGRDRAVMDVEFFDGAGEFFEAPLNEANRKVWREGYLHASVMVFCLPIWAAFPSHDMSPDGWQKREVLLNGLEQVVENYTDVRGEAKQRQPVKTILALTQADDRRSALSKVYDNWISPYMDSPATYLRQLRKGSGVARYLANARQVSAALHEELLSSEDPRVAAIPQKLDFGGRPWLIPVSAIEGSKLDQMTDENRRPGMKAPVPVHVELPLLVALCERDNALM